MHEAPLVPSTSIKRSFSRPWLICEAVTVPERAVLETDHRRAVIVERAAWFERLQMSRSTDSGMQAGDVASQVVGMCGDVAEAASGAAFPGSVRQAACFWF